MHDAYDEYLRASNGRLKAASADKLFFSKEEVSHVGLSNPGEALYEFLAINNWERLITFFKRHGSFLPVLRFEDSACPSTPKKINSEKKLASLLSSKLDFLDIDYLDLSNADDIRLTHPLHSYAISDIFSAQQGFKFLLQIAAVVNGRAKPVRFKDRLSINSVDDSDFKIFEQMENKGYERNKILDHSALFDCWELRIFLNDDFAPLSDVVVFGQDYVEHGIELVKALPNFNIVGSESGIPKEGLSPLFERHFGQEGNIERVFRAHYQSKDIEISGNSLWILVGLNNFTDSLSEDLIIRLVSSYLLQRAMFELSEKYLRYSQLEYCWSKRGISESADSDLFSSFLKEIRKAAIANTVGGCKECGAPIDLSKERGAPREFCDRKHRSTCATNATNRRRDTTIRLHFEGFTGEEIAEKIKWNIEQVEKWTTGLPTAGRVITTSKEKGKV